MESEENFKYKVPLLRLKIEYSGNHSVINISRFGEKFKDRIANRFTFLHFWRRSPEAVKAKERRERNETNQADKDYVFAYNHEDNSTGFANLLNTLDKVIMLKKPIAPHLSVDSLNFKKLLRNCVEKNQNMENWYDNFYTAAV